MLGILLDLVLLLAAAGWAGEEVERKESAIWLEVMPVGCGCCRGAGGALG